jgi:hypothetical protein
MISVLFAVPLMAATLVADQPAVVPIGPPQPVVTPDTIRADREKFEREYRLNTSRPWDGRFPARPREPDASLPSNSSGPNSNR